MSAHELWHVVVLVATLFGAAALVLILLTPLLFDETPGGIARARPFLVGGAVVALVLFLTEWVFVH